MPSTIRITTQTSTPLTRKQAATLNRIIEDFLAERLLKRFPGDDTPTTLGTDDPDDDDEDENP